MANTWDQSVNLSASATKSGPNAYYPLKVSVENDAGQPVTLSNHYVYTTNLDGSDVEEYRASGSLADIASDSSKLSSLHTKVGHLVLDSNSQEAQDSNGYEYSTAPQFLADKQLTDKVGNTNNFFDSSLDSLTVLYQPDMFYINVMYTNPAGTQVGSDNHYLQKNSQIDYSTTQSVPLDASTMPKYYELDTTPGRNTDVTPGDPNTVKYTGDTTQYIPVNVVPENDDDTKTDNYIEFVDEHGNQISGTTKYQVTDKKYFDTVPNADLFNTYFPLDKSKYTLGPSATANSMTLDGSHSTPYKVVVVKNSDVDQSLGTPSFYLVDTSTKLSPTYTVTNYPYSGYANIQLTDGSTFVYSEDDNPSSIQLYDLDTVARIPLQSGSNVNPTLYINYAPVKPNFVGATNQPKITHVVNGTTETVMIPLPDPRTPQYIYNYRFDTSRPKPANVISWSPTQATFTITSDMELNPTEYAPTFFLKPNPLNPNYVGDSSIMSGHTPTVNSPAPSSTTYTESVTIPNASYSFDETGLPGNVTLSNHDKTASFPLFVDTQAPTLIIQPKTVTPSFIGDTNNPEGVTTPVSYSDGTFTETVTLPNDSKYQFAQYQPSTDSGDTVTSNTVSFPLTTTTSAPILVLTAKPQPTPAPSPSFGGGDSYVPAFTPVVPSNPAPTYTEQPSQQLAEQQVPITHNNAYYKPLTMKGVANKPKFYVGKKAVKVSPKLAKSAKVVSAYYKNGKVVYTVKVDKLTAKVYGKTGMPKLTFKKGTKVYVGKKAVKVTKANFKKVHVLSAVRKGDTVKYTVKFNKKTGVVYAKLTAEAKMSVPSYVNLNSKYHQYMPKPSKANPFYVHVTKDLLVHNTKHFTKKNGRKVLKKGMDLKVIGLVSDHHMTRFELTNGKFITGLKAYVEY